MPLKNLTVHSVAISHKIYIKNFGFVTQWHYTSSFLGEISESSKSNCSSCDSEKSEILDVTNNHTVLRNHTEWSTEDSMIGEHYVKKIGGTLWFAIGGVGGGEAKGDRTKTQTTDGLSD